MRREQNRVKQRYWGHLLPREQAPQSLGWRNRQTLPSGTPQIRTRPQAPPNPLTPLSSSLLDNRFPGKPRNSLFGIVNHVPEIGELPSKSLSQLGEHPVELFRVIDADSLRTKLANAFLERKEGHGPSTMPQSLTLFDNPSAYPRLRKSKAKGLRQCVRCPTPASGAKFHGA
jgi:hypothetical protein